MIEVAKKPLIHEESDMKSQSPVSFEGLIFAMATLVCVATAASWAAKLHWTLELACHFKVQYLMFLVPSAALALYTTVRKKRGWTLAAALGVFTLLNLAEVAPLWVYAESNNAHAVHAGCCTIGHGAQTAGHESQTACHGAQTAGQEACESGRAATLRVMKFNVLTMNPRKDLVIASILRHDPDLVLCEEVDSEWVNALNQALKLAYPHHIALPRRDNFGISLFSKLPFGSAEIVHLDPSDPIPGIIATVIMDSGKNKAKIDTGAGIQSFTFFGMHVLPPRSKDYAESRNRSLGLMAGFLRDIEGPAIFMGDLNAAPWSPYFKDFLAGSGLVNTMRGFGIQPTWPTGLPRFARIPIDHCLVSRHFRVVSRFNGDKVGSDHLPVVVDLKPH